MKHRRERTHRLIALGGLVLKSGLADLVFEDSATLLGAMLHLADQLGEPDRAHLLAVWRRRGRRAFDVDALISVSPKKPQP